MKCRGELQFLWCPGHKKKALLNPWLLMQGLAILVTQRPKHHLQKRQWTLQGILLPKALNNDMVWNYITYNLYSCSLIVQTRNITSCILPSYMHRDKINYISFTQDNFSILVLACRTLPELMSETIKMTRDAF
jgi:hypothetical protein